MESWKCHNIKLLVFSKMEELIKKYKLLWDTKTEECIKDL